MKTDPLPTSSTFLPEEEEKEWKKEIKPVTPDM